MQQNKANRKISSHWILIQMCVALLLSGGTSCQESSIEVKSKKRVAIGVPIECSADVRTNCVATAGFPSATECGFEGSNDCLAKGSYVAISKFSLNPQTMCLGTALAGVYGAVSCEKIFDNYVSSTAGRRAGSPALTIANENSGGVDRADYLFIPDIFLSADGHFAVGGTEQTLRSQNQSAPNQWVDGTPKIPCGNAGSVEQRVQDCIEKNGSNATWDGQMKGKYGEGLWRLIVLTASSFEVWRDDRTKLLWSDYIGKLRLDRFASTNPTPAMFNWCVASGNAQSNDPSNYCNSSTYQNPPPDFSALSLCAEATGLYTPRGVDPSYLTFNAGPSQITGHAAAQWNPANEDLTIIEAKGNLSNTSTPSVQWRLPTLQDWRVAQNNGAGSVFPSLYIPWNPPNPSIYPSHWTSTLNSGYLPHAWDFAPAQGYAWYDNNRGTAARAVRCIGRIRP